MLKELLGLAEMPGIVDCFVFYLLPKAEADLIKGRIEALMGDVNDIDDLGIKEYPEVTAFYLTLADEDGDQTNYVDENTFHHLLLVELKKLRVTQVGGM